MHEIAASYRSYEPSYVENAIGESRRFYESMSTRRSVRQFSEKPIPVGVLENAILAAGTAPSGANAQPWFFAIIKSQELKEKLRVAAEKVEHDFYQKNANPEWLSDLAPLGTSAHKPHLTVAPAIIAVFTRQRPLSTQTFDMKRSYYPMESTGIAVGILLTALHQAGLSTLTHTPRPMNFLNELLDLDQSYRPYLMVVTGHAASPCVVPAIERKSFSEIAREY